MMIRECEIQYPTHRDILPQLRLKVYDVAFWSWLWAVGTTHYTLHITHYTLQCVCSERGWWV